MSVLGNEGRIVAWVNVRGGLRVFSAYFWQSERWTPRSDALLEAVVKQAKVTRHPWVIACDAHVSPEDCEKRMWFQSRQVVEDMQGAVWRRPPLFDRNKHQQTCILNLKNYGALIRTQFSEP